MLASPKWRCRAKLTLKRTAASDLDENLFSGICLVQIICRNRKRIQSLNQWPRPAIKNILPGHTCLIASYRSWNVRFVSRIRINRTEERYKGFFAFTDDNRV